MENLEAFYRENPHARVQANLNASRLDGGSSSTGESYRLNAIVTIPVVVHIVLGNPNQITDADVNYFINRLNLDFSGLNPDSANAGAFMPLRGHSQIRFCAARRTPSGQVTNGIERRTSTTQANSSQTNDPIKSTAAGGLDAWNNQSYFNIWVGVGASGLLGYATFPGTVGASQDGVFVSYLSFANNSCYTFPEYNLGRTAVHEVGHYLGLYHIWGDDGTACTGDDFRQLPGSSCVLPAGLFNPAGQGNTASDVGDTPNQAGASASCLTGVVTDACATTAPGKMYQNYMDYTYDACYSMFTNKQAARMEWVIDNCRAGLKTSLGCTPPTGAITVDAAPLASVNPGGNELNGCNTITYPSSISCPGSFIPKVRIVNNGLNTLTTVTVGYRLNNGAPVTVTVSPNLALGASTVVTFPAISVNANTTYNFRYYTANPNSTNPDQNPANDSLTAVLTVSGASALPVSQGFEAAAIAPWTIVNPDGDFTWIRATPGSSSATAAVIDNYNNNGLGRTDDIRSPVVNTTGTDSVIITFDVAHKNYPLAPYDVLQVLVSSNCGTTFTSVYSKSGPTLATAGPSTAAYIAPAAGDWRRERIAIGGALIASGQIQIAFRNVNQYGNNIWLDNINISKKVERDLAVSTISSPVTNICSNNFVPQVVVSNVGGAAVTSFTVGYRINGGAPVTQNFTQTIAPNASATITLAAATVAGPGNYTFTAFTANPVGSSGSGDQQAGNDTLSKPFTVANVLPLPLVQGFEGATFPPANWTLINPNNNNTWVRDNYGRNSAYSAKIDNYNFDLVGQSDILQTPALRTTGTDSLIIAFDVAHKNYTGSFDSLKVLVSTDCGNTFATYYARAGATLATAGSSTADYVAPAESDWRRDRISIPSAGFSGGNAIVRFQAINDFGNNIFLDNVNISAVYRRDAQLLAINQPGSVVCTSSVTPEVIVRNAGVEAITGLRIAYTVDNGAPVQTTLTNLNLVAGATQVFSLAAVTLSAGPHVFRAYTADPVTASGTGDPNPSNDTLSKAIAVVGTQAAPLVEGFEGTTFPPVGWAINNVDGGQTWQRTNRARKSGTDTSSAYVNNYNYNAAGSRDDLYTPRVTYTGVDSVFLTFDVAATTFSYPGSTALPLDTLEVLVTTDCGATLTSVYKKWGNELQTVSDPNNPQTTEFVPTGTGQWRREQVALPAYVNRSPIQVVFRNTTNFENNIFIDNVNLSTKTLPAQLKEQGYLIYPTPFTTSFTIQHYLPPTELRGIAVYNSVGQRMFAQSYGNNGATSLINVDMSRYASGLYTVVLQYANRTISQKIIKSH